MSSSSIKNDRKNDKESDRQAEKVPIDSIRLESSSNKLSLRDIDCIKSVMKDIGQFRIISVDNNGKIIDGAGIFRAAQDLGYREVLVKKI